MYVAAFEAIPNDGSDPGQDNCHMAVYGAHVHPSDGVWVECSVWQKWSHCQCVRCHSTLLKGHNSLAATLKLYQLIKHHTFHSYAYSQVHARLGIRTAIADYVHRVLNWPSREVKGRASLQLTEVCSLVGKNNISGEVFTVSICVNANSALPLDVT